MDRTTGHSWVVAVCPDGSADGVCGWAAIHMDK
jgi:hypothetical protein